MIEAGEAKRIQVSGSRVTVFGNDGTSQDSVKDEGSVVEQFLNLGVSEEALAATDLSFEDNSAWNSIMTIVVTLGPLLLIIWIFSRSFRQLRDAGKQGARNDRVEAIAPSNEERFRQLQSLYDDDLVTEAEFEKKRAEILAAL